ncbi:MAG: peptidase M13 [Vicinamibacteria bacterium]|nr:peptidase M13 [Vicinamibacteria bacterium]
MNSRNLAAALLLACALPAAAEDAAVAQRYGAWGVDLAGMDRSVKPGDDFFRFVNGAWADRTTIPADKTSYGAFNMLRDVSEARVRAILDGWAADRSLKPGSDEHKVATFYRGFLDEAAAEEADVAPLQPVLQAIRAAKDHADAARLMARGLTGFGASLVGPAIFEDQKDPEVYALYLSQSGLGLADREFYLRDNFAPQKQRYQEYVAQMLGLAGWEGAESAAAAVVAFETQVAQAHWTRAESRDRDKTYNPTTIAALEKEAPGLPWTAWFDEAGLASVAKVIVRQNTALPKLSALFAATPLPTLQAWLAFHAADDAAPLLSKRFVDAQWEFRSKFLNGVQEQRPRWKRAVDAAEGAMGEAIGRRYVALHFPAASKQKMEKLVADLRLAMEKRILGLAWMQPATKQAALQKLAKFGVKIGYPERWRDYSALEVKDGDLVGNALRSARFEWDYRRGRIGQKSDDLEWGMTPQTVNAYYSPTKNEIVFPAAILQPPFFDPEADDAVNYGAIGAVIGHEITHGFDDQGRKSDGDGALRDWWLAADATAFDAEAAKLGAQYEKYEFANLPGLHIIPRLTMGENIGDLGGILLGLEGCRLSRGGQPAPVRDGFTGEQRVFLGWAQVWRTLFRDDALRQYLMTNSHSPGMIRAFAPLRNVDAWYAAFDVKPGDRHYLAPEARVRIW